MVCIFLLRVRYNLQGIAEFVTQLKHLRELFSSILSDMKVRRCSRGKESSIRSSKGVYKKKHFLLYTNKRKKIASDTVLNLQWVTLKAILNMIQEKNNKQNQHQKMNKIKEEGGEQFKV